MSESPLKVEGAVITPLRLSVSDLRTRYPVHTLRVRYLRNTVIVETEFSGVLLWDILSHAQPIIDPHVTDDQLSLYVVATAADGFLAVFSWGELDPEFGNHRVLIAFEQDGKPLADKRGALRLVAPGDWRGGRYVGNLVSIVVRDAPTV